MMLPTQGPDTTLMEDLEHLGLAEEKGEKKAASNKKGDGYAEPDDKGGDFAGPPGKKESAHTDEWGQETVDVGDGPAGHRTNVPVGADGKFDKEAKAEDEDYDEDYVDEGSYSKMVPSFMVPTENEVQEAEEQARAQAEEDQLTKAWQVVHAYFNEDNDGLNEAGLRGVINAMGFCLDTCVEDISNLVVENEQLVEAVNELTGLLQEQENGEDEDEKEKGDEEEEEEEEGEKKKMPAFFKKFQKEARESRANLTEDASLNSILDEVRSIGAAPSPKAEAIDKQAKLIEAFEDARNTCHEIVGQIVRVIGEDQGIEEGEEPDLYEDDERVQLAQFFQSIAEDCASYLGRLAEGDVPFKVAEADLGKLFKDMEQGVEAMHTIE
jgi:hypothetical protein